MGFLVFIAFIIVFARILLGKSLNRPTLADYIKIEVSAGRLPKIWTVRDLKKNKNLGERYSVNTLNTMPTNLVVGGNCVRIGDKKPYRYQLYDSYVSESLTKLSSKN